MHPPHPAPPLPRLPRGARPHGPPAAHLRAVPARRRGQRHAARPAAWQRPAGDGRGHQLVLLLAAGHPGCRVLCIQARRGSALRAASTTQLPLWCIVDWRVPREGRKPRRARRVDAQAFLAHALQPASPAHPLFRPACRRDLGVAGLWWGLVLVNTVQVPRAGCTRDGVVQQARPPTGAGGHQHSMGRSRSCRCSLPSL